MAKIAYILLCHKDPDAIIKQAERLTAVGDFVTIHFDASAARSDYTEVRAALDENPAVSFTKKRIRCGWGEWSLVKATLIALETAITDFPRASHFYMLSGDCMPIKTAEYTHRFLDTHDLDFIESVDFFNSYWIKTGWRAERVIYRHFVNERTHRWLFYTLFEIQKHLGLTRSVPEGMQLMIGSQWWCLRRKTITRILAFTKKRRDITRFFSTTWIPDETFFQTLVRHLVPHPEIESRTPTFLAFTDYGMPVNFYNDQYDLLLSQDYLFARKISPEATELKRRLGMLYAAKDVDFPISNNGRAVFEFLTQRGRIGRRFGQRFWESEATLGRERELMIIISKKWNVARRLIDQLSFVSDIPALEYVFNDETSLLPDLGGIQSTLIKRHRHRRTLMRMLFDYYKTDRMILCIDPGNLDLLKDFEADRSRTRFLELDCIFSDDALAEYAKKSGLAGAQTPESAVQDLLPTLRDHIFHESDLIQDQDFENLFRIRETDDAKINARQLAEFMAISPRAALKIAQMPDLFSD